MTPQCTLQIGNWSRWLADFFGKGPEQSAKDDENSLEDDYRWGLDETNPFQLLNALSDLLMLPKDMLMDRTVRMEVTLIFRLITFFFFFF